MFLLASYSCANARYPCGPSSAERCKPIMHGVVKQRQRIESSVKVEREGAFGEGITADDLVPGG